MINTKKFKKLMIMPKKLKTKYIVKHAETTDPKVHKLCKKSVHNKPA